MKKYILVLLTILSLGLFLNGCNSSKDSGSVLSEQDSSAKIAGDIIKDAYINGPADAKITIVEFSDFQCPACGYAYAQVKQLMEKYPADIRLAYRHFPLSYHQYAQEAAYSVEAAGKQGKFWEMYDLIFSNQKDLSLAKFAEFAKQLNLDIGQFNSDKTSDTIRQKVQADLQEAETLGLTGTPSFFINGQVFTKNATLANFESAVNKILGK